MILIADASALIVLACCDSLELLEALFGNILVPTTVFYKIELGIKFVTALPTGVVR
jgi:predicted nucleic acid-binding protein